MSCVTSRDGRLRDRVAGASPSSSRGRVCEAVALAVDEAAEAVAARRRAEVAGGGGDAVAAAVAPPKWYKSEVNVETSQAQPQTRPIWKCWN